MQSLANQPVSHQIGFSQRRRVLLVLILSGSVGTVMLQYREAGRIQKLEYLAYLAIRGSGFGKIFCHARSVSWYTPTT